MIIAPFYAPRPEHPFFQDYSPFLELQKRSCAKFGHRQLVLSDVALEAFDTFVCDLPKLLMKAVTKAQLDFLKAGPADNVLLTGADCIISGDLDKVFEQEFDVAFTTHPFSDCILNTGAIFVRKGANVCWIWEKALEICGEEWGDDQLSLAKVVEATLEHGLYERNGTKVRFLPLHPWNVAPSSPDDPCDNVALLHFRGPRKSWMIDYCAHHLDLCDPMQVKALCNTPEERIFDNILANSALDVPWVVPIKAHEEHAVICGGGPSLKDTIGEIRSRYVAGQKIICLNNVGNYLKAEGIEPYAQVVLDARPSNADFVGPHGIVYVGSQCDPQTFRRAGDRAVLFHPALDGLADRLPKTGKEAWLITTGPVVGLAALNLFHTLGFRKFHLYGYDSSERDGEMHPYPQDENSAEKKRLTVWCDGKWYRTQFAFYKQAEDFPIVAANLADMGSIITVHGDGLLPAVARVMARNQAAELSIAA